MHSLLEPWIAKWTALNATWTHPNGNVCKTGELLEYGWSDAKILDWFLKNHPVQAGTQLHITTADYELDV